MDIAIKTKRYDNMVNSYGDLSSSKRPTPASLLACGSKNKKRPAAAGRSHRHIQLNPKTFYAFGTNSIFFSMHSAI